MKLEELPKDVYLMNKIKFDLGYYYCQLFERSNTKSPYYSEEISSNLSKKIIELEKEFEKLHKKWF